MPDAGLVKFADFAPDLTSINTGVSPIIQNVLPRADGYGPMPSLSSFSATLPSQCRGAFNARSEDGSIVTFAATSNAIYKLTTPNNVSFGWVLVSPIYTALPTTDCWQFAQFNNLILAAQTNIVPQVYNLLFPTAFADLGGTPPAAGHITIVNQFIVLTDLATVNMVKWSALGNPVIWTPGVLESDEQVLEDGGFVRHCAGGDNYGVIFQDGAVRTMTFAPGSPVVFTILRVSKDDGMLGEYSAVQSGNVIFYYSYQGFKSIAPGGYPEPIGKEKVDRFFINDLDQNNMQFFVATSDPVAPRLYWTYKSNSNRFLVADKILVYDWMLKKWTLITGQTVQFLIAQSIFGLQGNVTP